MKWMMLFFCLLVNVANAQVMKCKIDGKTVYSNTGCDSGFAVKTIDVQQVTGVTLAKPHEIQNNVDQARNAISNREQVKKFEDAQVQNKVMVMPPVSRIGGCADIQGRLNELYAQARLPLSGSEHDEIRRIIRQLRDLQTTYKC
jgi:hypothetical protein